MQHLEHILCSLYSRILAAVRASQNRKDRQGTTQNVDLILATFTAEMLQHFQHNSCTICSTSRRKTCYGSRKTCYERSVFCNIYSIIRAAFRAHFVQHLQQNSCSIYSIPKSQRHTGNDTKRGPNSCSICSTNFAAFAAEFLQHLQQR